MMRPLTLLTLLTFFFSTALIAQSTGKKANLFFEDVQTSSRNSGVPPYTLTTTNEPYADLVNPVSVNNDELWDDPVYVVPVDFPFELNGHTISTLQFGGVGFLLVAPTADPEIATVVFPFEMDLIDRGILIDDSQSPISYLVEGDPGSRIQKIEIKNAGSYGEFDSGSQDMFINIQLWLYEGSNLVEFRFGENLIDNPVLFYEGQGIFMGISDVNLNTGVASNANFFGGDINAPELFAADVTIEGTPAEGTVYRLSISVPLDVTISSENSTSTCSPNGTATVEAIGGTPPFTFLWSNGETTATISNLDAGTYSVTVTDSDGAIGIASVDITNVDPLLANASATSETSQDADDGTATANPTGGDGQYTFLWSNGETTSAISDLPPGVYTVTVTDGEGCTAVQSVTVNAFECLGLAIVANVLDALCFGGCNGSIEIVDITGGTPPYTYLWSNGANTESTFDLCAGIYSVTVVDGAGCEITDAFFVNEGDEFFANAGATSESGTDENDGTAWASPSGDFDPFTYEWSNGSTDSLIVDLTPGTYTVTVTDSNGCTAVESIEVFEFMCIGFAGFDIQNASCFGTCDGALSAFVGFGGVGPYTYLWSTGETTQEIFDLCAEFYDVTITDEGQGCDIVGTVFVDEPIFPVIVFIDLVTHVTDSTTGAIEISVSGLLPIIYEWTGPNGYSSQLKNITDLEPGIYTVVATDGNGCSDTQTVEILNQTVGLYGPYTLDVKIYPNPANENIYIVLADALSAFKVQLINPDGRRLATWDSKNAIDVSNYPPGMYFLRISSGENYFVHRFNIMR